MVHNSNASTTDKQTSVNGHHHHGINGNTQTTTISTEMTIANTIRTPVAPDGGWGWMVVFGSFMIHIITDGITYSFGLFYNEFLRVFNEGKGYTAWIVSIMVGVTFASGPISSSFVNRYGCRAVTITGAIIAAGSIIASIFAQNIFTLIITIGFGAGFGFGLIYLPAIVSVTTYFEKKRSLATGIAVCGSGFGTFVFAPLSEHLIDTYGWRGALLIIGGIVLNCIIFGVMFRPLEMPSIKKSTIIDNNTTMAELAPLRSNKIQQTEQYLPVNNRPDVATSNAVMLMRSNSVGHAYDGLQNNNNTKDFLNNKINYGNIAKSTSNDINNMSVSQTHLRGSKREISASGPMYRPDILYQGSLLNIPAYTRSRTDLTAAENLHRYGSLKHSMNSSESQNLPKCCGQVTCSKETNDALSEMTNFALLKDGIFLIFAISNFCTSIGLNMPYVYIVALADTLNLDTEQSSYLIAIIGIANTVGRIVLGYISDKTWVNRLWVYNICLVSCGIATILSPLCYNIITLGIYCGVFGFTIGAYVGLTSVILVDLLGLDKLTNAFGILLLFQGVASFIGAPIGGWLYDISKSYSYAFILAGVMIFLSGAVMFAIPPLQRYNARKLKEENVQQMAIS